MEGEGFNISNLLDEAARHLVLANDCVYGALSMMRENNATDLRAPYWTDYLEIRSMLQKVRAQIREYAVDHLGGIDLD